MPICCPVLKYQYCENEYQLMVLIIQSLTALFSIVQRFRLTTARDPRNHFLNILAQVPLLVPGVKGCLASTGLASFDSTASSAAFFGCSSETAGFASTIFFSTLPSAARMLSTLVTFSEKCCFLSVLLPALDLSEDFGVMMEGYLVPTLMSLWIRATPFWWMREWA